MIHKTAIIDSHAELAADVKVGAYSIIGPNVKIDAGTCIESHCVINGPCQIGKNNQIYSFASIGGDPQDKKFKREQTQLIIGDDNVIREYVTINRGTGDGGGVTRLGNDNWIMAYVHIAHDCIVGDHTIFSNAASLAGHVTVGDYCILSGFTLVSQFVAIGAYSFSTMGSAINRDVPPFMLVSGNMAKPKGINSEGLRRHQFSAESVSNIKKAYKTLYLSGKNLQQALAEIAAIGENDSHVQDFANFISQSKKGVIR